MPLAHVVLTSLALAGETFVQREFVDAVRAGRPWDENRLITQVILTDGEAQVQDYSGDAPARCLASVTGDVVRLACPGRTHTLTRSGDALVPDSPDELGGTLVRTTWTVGEHFRRVAVARSRAVLPAVAGTWRRGDERLVLSAATVGDPTAVRLEPCDHGAGSTVCVSLGDDRFAWVGDHLVPATVYGDCGCEGSAVHDLVSSLDPGPHWLRDIPCARALCAVEHDDGARRTRWVPTGGTIERALGHDEAVLGGTVTLELGAPVDHVEIRFRPRTRVVLAFDGLPLPLAALDVAGPWSTLVGGSRVTIPAEVVPEPVPLDRDALLAAVETALDAVSADGTVRGRAREVAWGCATAQTPPCSVGIGAFELELTAWQAGQAVDRVAYVVEGPGRR